MFEEMDAVFGAGNPRLVRVSATQTGSTQILADHLAIFDSPVHNPRRIYPDVFSPAPYFGHSVDGNAADAVAQLRTAITGSTAESRRTRQYLDSAGTSRSRVFRQVAYEGGQHVLNAADVINRNAAMYTLYVEYLDSMSRFFDEFVHYAHSGTFGSGGAWGAKEYIGQELALAHKYRALLNYLSVTPGTVDFSPPTVPTGLAAIPAGTGAITLSWIASTDAGGIDGYQVFQNGVYVGYASGVSYTVAGLVSDATYAYSIKAVDTRANVSRMSDTLDVVVDRTGVARATRRTPGAPSIRLDKSTRGLVIDNAQGLRAVSVFDLAGRQLFCALDIRDSKLSIAPERAAGAVLVRMMDRDGVERVVRVLAP